MRKVVEDDLSLNVVIGKTLQSKENLTGDTSVLSCYIRRAEEKKREQQEEIRIK